jgi:hypothetical protein
LVGTDGGTGVLVGTGGGTGVLVGAGGGTGVLVGAGGGTGVLVGAGGGTGVLVGAGGGTGVLVGAGGGTGVLVGAGGTGVFDGTIGTAVFDGTTGTGGMAVAVGRGGVVGCGGAWVVPVAPASSTLVAFGPVGRLFAAGSLAGCVVSDVVGTTAVAPASSGEAVWVGRGVVAVRRGRAVGRLVGWSEPDDPPRSVGVGVGVMRLATRLPSEASDCGSGGTSTGTSRLSPGTGVTLRRMASRAASNTISPSSCPCSTGGSGQIE